MFPFQSITITDYNDTQEAKRPLNCRCRLANAPHWMADHYDRRIICALKRVVAGLLDITRTRLAALIAFVLTSKRWSAGVP